MHGFFETVIKIRAFSLVTAYAWISRDREWDCEHANMDHKYRNIPPSVFKFCLTIFHLPSLTFYTWRIHFPVFKRKLLGYCRGEAAFKLTYMRLVLIKAPTFDTIKCGYTPNKGILKRKLWSRRKHCKMCAALPRRVTRLFMAMHKLCTSVLVKNASSSALIHARNVHRGPEQLRPRAEMKSWNHYAHDKILFRIHNYCSVLQRETLRFSNYKETINYNVRVVNTCKSFPLKNVVSISTNKVLRPTIRNDTQRYFKLSMLY